MDCPNLSPEDRARLRREANNVRASPNPTTPSNPPAPSSTLQQDINNISNPYPRTQSASNTSHDTTTRTIRYINNISNS